MLKTSTNLKSIKLKPKLKSKLCRSFCLTFIFWLFTALGYTILFSRFQQFEDGQCAEQLTLQETVVFSLAQILICGSQISFFCFLNE